MNLGPPIHHWTWAANSFHASLPLANVVASSHVVPARSKSFLKVLLHVILAFFIFFCHLTEPTKMLF